jgi:hypothetical protein
MNEFDPVAKRLWFEDGPAAIEMVDGMLDRDRVLLEQRLFALYGAKVNLFGTTDDIRSSLENAKLR